MESVAVIKVAVCVKRVELVSLHQHHDKPFRTLATESEIRQKLVISLLLKRCECGKK